MHPECTHVSVCNERHKVSCQVSKKALQKIKSISKSRKVEVIHLISKTINLSVYLKKINID